MPVPKAFAIPAALFCAVAIFILLFARFDTFIFFGIPILAGVAGATILRHLDPERTTADQITDALRIYWGLHLIYSSYRFWVADTIPAIPHPVAGPFIEILGVMGVYPGIKAMEGLVGIMLVLNRWVPLMLVLEVPTSATIFYLNFFVTGTPRQLLTGPLELGVNCALLLAYFRYYRPFLVMKAYAAPPHFLAGSDKSAEARS